MRFTVLVAVGLVALLPALAGTAPGIPPAPPANVQFLFDLGDGTYAWANAHIEDPTATNATWDAVLAAAAQVHLYVSWAWSSAYGVSLLDIGNRSPPSGFVGLFLWSGTADAWEPSAYGVSGLILADGAIVALSDNAFDPVTFNFLTPVPTPDTPYPVIQFRQDAANSGFLPTKVPRQYGLLWERNVGVREIPASPTVAYGSVFALTLDGMFAMNELNGTFRWSNLNVRGLSTPAAFNGSLLVGGSDGRIHAVDALTGTERWNTTLIPNPVFSGITSSPKIVFDTAYVGTFNETGGTGDVVALWATNGTVIWKHAAPGSISFSSPAIVNGTLFVGVIGRYNTSTQITYDPPYGVLALDAATGGQRWFHATTAPVAASPLVLGSRVFVPSEDGNLLALNASSGGLLWQAPVDAGISSPAWTGTSLVVGGGSFGSPGTVTALDPATGASLWTYTPNGPVQSSITSADGQVFFATNTATGRIYSLNATSGRLVWDYTPTPAQFILATPVAADGFLFGASDNGRVYAFKRTTQDPSAFASVRGPGNLAAGQEGNITVTVSAPNGTWDRAFVRVDIPSGLDVVSTSPALSSGTTGTGTDLGPVLFGETATFNMTVRPNASVAGGSTLSVPITVTFAAGSEVLSYGLPVVSILVPRPAPSFLEAYGLWIAVAAVATVAAAGLVLLYRRRSRHAP